MVGNRKVVFSVFDNETPSNITSIPVDDVWKLVEDPEGFQGPSPRVRLNYVKMLYDVLGLDLTPDAALATIAMGKSTLILAIAGGGKTTLVHVKALLYKLTMLSNFRKGKKMTGKEILYLVYNKHNVADAEEKQRKMVTKLRMAKIKGLEIDSDLHVRTMHSFCEFWRKQYAAKMGLVGFTSFGDEWESLAAMGRAIRIAYKMLKEKEDPAVTAKNLLALYNYSKETMKTVDELENTDKFIELGIPLTVVEKCFERYEASKNLKKKYDYCDILTKVCTLLENDKKVLEQVQTYYTTIFADEVQDFTPVMWKILRLLTNNGTYLNCIGDEDQNLYNFRGADIFELLSFKQSFEDASVYTLVHNRRCCSAILDEAREVISDNQLRFSKNIVGLKEGGSIEFIPYNTVEGQIYSVVESIASLTADQQWDTVICFREHACSKLLIDCLEEKQIRFNSLQGVLPFNHEIYRHLIGILNALEAPCNRDICLDLYKVLPCSRLQLAEAMGYDMTKGRFKQEVGRKHFAEYDYGDLLQVNGMVDTLKELIEISKMIATEPMSRYMNRVFQLFNRYFWNFIKQQHDVLACDEIFEERARKMFMTDETFSEFFDSYTGRINICRRNNDVKAGLTISTFHGLKGLEFDRVYAIFLDDEVFPNFTMIDNRNYPSKVALELKESETRLWYVTLTRAKSYFCGYYYKNRSSKYIQDFFDRKNGVFIKERRTVPAANDFSEDDFDEQSQTTEAIDTPVTEPVPVTDAESVSVSQLTETVVFNSADGKDFSEDDFSVEDFENCDSLKEQEKPIELQPLTASIQQKPEKPLADVQHNARLATMKGDYLSRLLTSLGRG